MRTVAIALALAAAGPATAVPVDGQGTWQTTLLPRDLDGDRIVDAFYDTALNVTWLKDAGSSGRLSWAEAMQRAEGLTIGGYTDWRLPRVLDTGNPGCSYAASGTDCGYNVQTADASGVYSEIAHLFFVTLGNKSKYDTFSNEQPGYGLNNTGGFSDLRAWDYWSGTELVTDSAHAWHFYMIDGAQLTTEKSATMFTLILRSGDVAPVPEPGSTAMLLAGLCGLLLRARPPRIRSLWIHGSGRTVNSNCAVDPTVS